jgi:hypothetical protein
MSDRFLEIVRLANREFQAFIDEVEKNGAKVAKTPGAVRRLEKVAHRLNQVDGFLAHRARPVPAGADSEYEILKYRENLKALKGIMETLQYSLLVEKSHIENTRANVNVQAASAWAQSLRQTS